MAPRPPDARDATLRAPARRHGLATHPSRVTSAARAQPAPRKAEPRVARRAPVTRTAKTNVAVVAARRDRFRIAVVLVLVCMLLCGIAVRLMQLQFVQGGHWRSLASRQTRSSEVLPGERGAILARDGTYLAISVPRDAVFADPELVQDPAAYAHSLAPLLHVNERDLLPLLRRHRNTRHQWVRFEPLASNVAASVSARISAMEFPGLYVRPQPRREYPGGSVAAALVGQTAPGEIGSTGLEFEYDDLLTGKAGSLDVARDQNGVEIPGSQRRFVPATRGNDVVLSIDQGIEYAAEQSLLDQVVAQQAHGGIAVVIDVRTGEVLAMASVVGASSRSAAHVATSGEANSALTFTYNPGSVMKLVPISRALDSGCITLETRFQVPDYIRSGRFVVKDDEFHPVEDWTVRDIITQSSNVGTMMIANQCFDATSMSAAVSAFGFGRTTGLGFPNEAPGLVLAPDRYYDTGVGSTAIGYSPSVSPMQLLDAYVTVARGGAPVRPRLVTATIDASGVRTSTPIVRGRHVVSAGTASEMRDILANVVRAGTGACAAVPGYEVAGKTGTVQKRSGAAFTSSRHMATFVGFAPAQRPKLAVAVVIDEPGNVYGARAAAPVFSEIMEFALQRMHVVPPPLQGGVTPQWDEAAATAKARNNDCSVPHGAALEQIVAGRVAAARRNAAALAQRAKHAKAKHHANSAALDSTTTLPAQTKSGN